MPRRINETKYEMSHRRYRMLVDYCYLYPEWQQWLKEHKDTIGSPVVDGQPHSPSGTSDPTEDLAMKRVEIEHKMQIIEESAKETSEYFAKWLLKDVTAPEISFRHLQHDMPCGRHRYFEMRKKFFKILDKKV